MDFSAITFDQLIALTSVILAAIVAVTSFARNAKADSMERQAAADKLDEIGRGVAETRAVVERLDGKLDSHADRIARAETRLEEHERRIKTVEERCERHMGDTAA
jgi:peptidoglycan hydrolase CwlO-like protein